MEKGVNVVIVEEETETSESESEDSEESDRGTCPNCGMALAKSIDSDDSHECSNLEKGTEDTEGGNEMDLDILKTMLGELLDEKLTDVKEEISKSVHEKVEALQKSVGEVKEETTSALTEVTDKVEKVEQSGAFKKSIDDSGEIEEDLVKAESFWNGTFVHPELIKVLGYDS